jgi:hypothetical protein
MTFVNLLAFTALLAPVQSTEWKPTDDGSGRFAQAYFKKTEASPETLDSTKRVPTLFFYWKARWLLNFEVGPWERAHLNVCRIVLGALDPAAGSDLKGILDAHDASKPFTVTEEEAKPFRSRMSGYMGIDLAVQGEAMSKLEKWETEAGIALGDVAGKLIQYHYTHTIPTAQRMFNEGLDSAKKSSEEVPEDANPKLVAGLKALADTPRKPEYTADEIKAISAKIEAALMTVIP